MTINPNGNSDITGKDQTISQLKEIELSDKINPNLKTTQGIPMYNVPGSASNIEMYGDPNDVKIVGYLKQTVYFKQLDAIRFIAVMMVMCNHWLFRIPNLKASCAALGSMGVNIFFVLSGFLISLILMNEKEKNPKINNLLRQFYIRRFLRIFPLYYLVILIAIIFGSPDVYNNLLALLFYLVNWKAGLKGAQLGVFSHFWSLSVEEQFYLFFPPLLVFINKKNFKLLSAIFIGGAILFRVIPFFLPKLYQAIGWVDSWTTFSCLDAFGMGFLLAILKIENPELLKRNIGKYLWLCILLGFVSFILYINAGDFLLINSLFFRTLSCVLALGLIGNAIFDKLPSIIFNNKIIIYLGRISYGLYVYHFFMINLFSVTLNKFINTNSVKGVLLSFVIYFALTVIVSSISYFLYESPLNKLKRYFKYNG
jgi:peptidoglycan/LPS O-acetylase OafA/YrhL